LIGGGTPPESPTNVLKRRYAVGEIDREEYLQKLKDLWDRGARTSRRVLVVVGAALVIALLAVAAEGLEFGGLQAYEGYLQNVEPFTERRSDCENALAVLATVVSRPRPGKDCENALTVLATVVSRPRPGKAMIDTDLKAVTPEFRDPTVLVPGATWFDFSEEHDELVLDGPAQKLRVGDRIELILRRGCTTTTLYDRYHVLEDEELVDVWRVTARGRFQ